MKKILILSVAVLLAIPASAKDITVTMSEEAWQATLQLLQEARPILRA